MGDRIAIITPEGEFGTIDADHADSLRAAGGKVLSKAEVKEKEAQDAYDAQSLPMKAATLGSMAGPIGYIPHVILRGHGGQLPPTFEAYVQGVSEGMTGDLASVGMKEAVRRVGGDEAAKAYAQTAADAREAHELAGGLGVGAGLIGGAVAGGPKAGLGIGKYALPGAALGVVGEGVERLAGRALSGLAARGVAGDALATAGKWAARGASEGAIYNAASYTGDAVFHDHEIAGEKLWAATTGGALGGALVGGGLGGAGALAKSGVRSLVGAGASAVERVLSKGETLGAKAEAAASEAKQLGREAVAEAKAVPSQLTDRARGEIGETLTKLQTGADRLAKDAGIDLAQEGQSLSKALGDVTADKVRGAAYDQAWAAIGKGFGMQSTGYAAKAAKFLPNGTRDVGEVLLRKGIINVEGGAIAAMREGTPAALLPKIESALGAEGSRVGAITDASGAVVPMKKIADAIDEILLPIEKKAGWESIAQGVRDYGDSLKKQLGFRAMPADIGTYPPAVQRAIAEKLLDGGVPVQKLLEQRKALDDLIWREGMPLNPSPRVEELRAVRTRLEGVVTDALDEASGRVPGALRDEYKAAKRDYMALSIAKRAAEDSATRMAKNRAISPTDYLAMIGGLASGHLITGPVFALGHKVIRERGNAAAAVLLSRAADTGIVTRAMRQIDDAIERGAKGLLSPAKGKGVAEAAPTESLIVRAQRAMQRVAAVQADPAVLADRVARQTEALGGTAPNVANQYSMQVARAASFLTTKMPVVPDRDPFDPHPAPRITHAQASEFLRYVDYVDRPQKFFDDMQRGKVTHEGAEVARALMPRAFSQLQARTAELVADELARGVRIPFAERQRIGTMLGIAVDPSQRPDHMQMLQANVQPPPPDPKLGGNSGPAAPAPKRPLSFKTQQSALDRLSSR